MDLSELSRTNRAFYAPTFILKLRGQDMTHSLAIGVNQVEADLSLGAAGRFSFTVVNGYDMKARAFKTGLGQELLGILEFGAPVEIGMGYGDRTRLPQVMTGVITEITTSFSEGGLPELQVAGHDSSFPMTLGKRSRSWSKATDSDVVSALAAEHNLSSDIESTFKEHPQIEQNQESDFEFVKKLALRNHYQLFVDANGVLNFKEANNKNDGLVTLKWGESLLSFKPEAKLGAQVSRVEVYGWDAQRKQRIVGVATAGEEAGHDPQRRSGGERVQALFRRPPVLQVRQPVFDEAEARRRALALLNDHAKEFLSGEAESLGLPELMPDCNVNFAGLGEPFSKTYYIEQSIHRFDSNGYRTRIKVKEACL